MATVELKKNGEAEVWLANEFIKQITNSHKIEGEEISKDGFNKWLKYWELVVLG